MKGHQVDENLNPVNNHNQICQIATMHSSRLQTDPKISLGRLVLYNLEIGIFCVKCERSTKTSPSVQKVGIQNSPLFFRFFFSHFSSTFKILGFRLFLPKQKKKKNNPHHTSSQPIFLLDQIVISNGFIPRWSRRWRITSTTRPHNAPQPAHQ